MSKNEIKKKNISANALGDDDLEDVAGGYIDNGWNLTLSKEEKDCLKKDPMYRKWCLTPKNISAEAYRKANRNKQIECLERHGFRKEN